MQAVKARDLELFKTVFSQRVQREEFAQVPGEPLLASYVYLWGDVLASHDVERVDYQVLPDREGRSGYARVVITMGEYEYPSLSVVREKGLWYVDER
jgi:hypothetical protein